MYVVCIINVKHMCQYFGFVIVDSTQIAIIYFILNVFCILRKLKKSFSV